MFWDIAIAVLVALTQFATAYLGWRVTLNPPVDRQKSRYEAAFVACGLLGIVLIALGTVRAISGSAALQQDISDLKKAQGKASTDIGKIEKNTEQPPVVNIPGPYNHSHLHFMDPFAVSGKPLPLPFNNGEIRHINAGWENVGEYPIRSIRTEAVLVVTKPDDRNKVFEETIKTLKPSVKGGTMLPHTLGAYYSFDVPQMSDAQVDSLNSGKLDLCMIGRSFWEDDTGKYETDHFECLHQGDGVFNWHNMGYNNRELKR